MRGALPLCTPQVGAPGPHDPHGEGAPPRTWTFFARGFAPLHSPSGGLWPPHPPWGGRSAPPPRVTFSPMRKSPKNLPEGTPLWVLPKGDASLPLRRGRNPLDRASDTEKDRFATFTLEANRSFVLSKSYRGNTFYFQSVARGLGEELG